MKLSQTIIFLFLLQNLWSLKDLWAQDFWQSMNVPDSSYIMNVKVNSSGDIFLGEQNTYSLPNYSAIQRSSDHGMTWIPVCPTAYGVVAGIDINQLGNIYAESMDTIFESVTNGDSWENRGYCGMSSVLKCGFDSIMLKGGYDYTAIVRSGDHGATWKVVLVLSGLWPWVTDFAYADNGMIYASIRVTDSGESGVYRSNDLGNTWEPFGLNNYAVYSVAMDNNGNLLAGTLGQGFFRYDMSTQQWTNLIDNTSIMGIFVSADNKFYLASSDMPTFNNLGGCIIYNDNDGTYYNQNSGLADHFMSDGITIDEERYLLLWGSGLLFKSIEQVITDVNSQPKTKPQNTFSNYPNPATGKINIEFHENPQGAEIEVFDVFGTMCYQTRLQPFAARIVITIDTWKPGVYIVKVRSGNRINGVERVIKI